MQLSLVNHPSSPADAVSGISVDLDWRADGRLVLRYKVSGQVARVLIPAPGEPGRADKLWEHTCFEVFFKAPGMEHYSEFNFSPSRAWAAYHFTGRRTGMINIAGIDGPAIVTSAGMQTIDVRVEMMAGTPPNAERPITVGLSTIIEETDGRKSYWALRHPEGKADFHHPDCFALRLPAAN